MKKYTWKWWMIFGLPIAPIAMILIPIIFLLPCIFIVPFYFLLFDYVSMPKWIQNFVDSFDCGDSYC